MALIAALAGLAGAVIAAVTAGRRQERQLAHDAERQERELRQDREIASLDDRRRVLDEAAKLLLQLEAAVGSFFADIDEIAYEFPASLGSLLSDADHVKARLTIRLGEDDAATAGFGRAIYEIRWVEDVVERANFLISEHGRARFQSMVEEGRSRVTNAIRHFLVAAKHVAS